jgi:uncharacterized repeat protein (TIGR03803 family)
MKLISTALIACLAGCFVYGTAVQASTEKLIYSFCNQPNCTDGQTPRGGLINVDGMLYGMTVTGGNIACDCGTLFAVDPQTGAETVLHSFQAGNDGRFPTGGIFSVGGTLYGMTAEGGAGDGTVFSYDLTTNTEAVLYSFCSKWKCRDGGFPDGGVIVGSTLYGVTSEGGKKVGKNGRPDGTVFSLRLDTGMEKVRYSFQYESTNGFSPVGSLVDQSDMLYGVTTTGGTGSCYDTGIDGCGTVFSLDLKNDTETVLHSFLYGATDGAIPEAGMIKVDHTLYGTTEAGGPGSCFGSQGVTGCGTVFALDLKTGVEKVIYFFCSQQNCADGQRPDAPLINVKGMFYGTTYQGGANGAGTVFSLDPKTGTETVLYSFCSQHRGQENCTDGGYPDAGLINVNGTLYGTTSAFGAHGWGTVFSIIP